MSRLPGHFVGADHDPPLHRLERVDGRPVCDRCTVAATPFARMRGLLGRAGLERGEGLLLRPAASIHTLFMRFPIDAVFVDDDLVVVGTATNLKPWRTASRRGARAVLELAAGECERRGIRAGDRLVFGERVRAAQGPPLQSPVGS